MADFSAQQSDELKDLTPKGWRNDPNFFKEDADQFLDIYPLSPLPFEETGIEMFWNDSPALPNQLLTTMQHSLKTKSRNETSLRTLSWQIKEIVTHRRKTTYKEVANDLVARLGEARNLCLAKNERNVRRRVYDALNVLVAAGVFAKEGNTLLAKPRVRREPQSDQLKEKHERLQELVESYVATRHLFERNNMQVRSGAVVPYPTSVVTVAKDSQYDLESNHVEI